MPFFFYSRLFKVPRVETTEDIIWSKQLMTTVPGFEAEARRYFCRDSVKILVLEDTDELLSFLCSVWWWVVMVWCMCDVSNGNENSTAMCYPNPSSAFWVFGFRRSFYPPVYYKKVYNWPVTCTDFHHGSEERHFPHIVRCYDTRLVANVTL